MSSRSLPTIFLWLLAVPALLLTLIAQDSPAPHVCNHGTSGDSKRLDLRAVEQAQAKAKAQVALKLKRIEKPSSAFGTRLPACTSSSDRSIALPSPVHKRLVGTRIVFVSRKGINNSNVPDNAAIVVVARSDLAGIAKLIGAKRPKAQNGIYVASAGMLKWLNITCLPSTLTFEDTRHARVQTGPR